nr:SOS response-associated peptidase [Syntrophomonas palmitatica]
MRQMQWGLVPCWAKDRTLGSKLINARWETIAEKASFKESLRQRRCLVPADGYYEWQGLGFEKQPYRFVVPSRDLFCFAGLWDEWIAEDGQVLQSFTIITTEAASAVYKIHKRMPFIIKNGQEDLWLRSGIIKRQEAQTFLSRFKPEDTLKFYRVSKMVNSVKIDVPECIQVLN